MPRLAAVGTFTADIIISGLSRIAGPGEVVYLESPVELRLGGHAVNVSIDSVRLGFDGEVFGVGAVGRDVFGDILIRGLEDEGVKAMVERVGVGTARNAIIVFRGEDRRFHVYLGANSRLSYSHVRRSLEEASPSHLYMALGYSRSLDSGARDLLGSIRASTEFILVDPAYTTQESVKALIPVLDLVDAIHLNVEELKMLTGAAGLEEALERVKRLKALVTVTGDFGAIAVYRGRVIRQPRFRVEVVEPTGAGDAFCAGLLKAVAEAGPLMDYEEVKRALLYAQAAGAAAVTSVGATSGVTSDRVRELVESMGEEVLKATEVL